MTERITRQSGTAKPYFGFAPYLTYLIMCPMASISAPVTRPMRRGCDSRRDRLSSFMGRPVTLCELLVRIPVLVTAEPAPLRVIRQGDVTSCTVPHLRDLKIRIGRFSI